MTCYATCRRNSALLLDAIVRFRVPHWMIDKMRQQMRQQRDVSRYHAPASVTSSSLAAASPANSQLQVCLTADTSEVLGLQGNLIMAF